MKYFTLDEFIRSETATIEGINNAIPDSLIPNAIRTLETLDIIRKKLGKPITITSGYRCNELNKAVGGSATSAHLSANAADLSVKGESVRSLFGKIATILKENNIPFDQLLAEKNSNGVYYCVHIGLGTSNRKQVKSIKWN